MKKKNFLFYLCMGFVLAASAAVVTGCKDKEKPPVDYGEEGMYYYTATDGEYWVILEEDTYKLWLGTELIEGTYSYDGTTFKMYKGSGEDAEAIPVAYADGELTITYNNGSYRFLEKLSYTVTYNVDGGSAIESTKVLNGKTLAKPADPVKAGYDFIGWYEDVEFKKPFAFNATPVTGDITLYARYVEDNYYGSEFKATLIVDGQEIDMVETKNGVLYDIPTPNKQDAEFLGWYVSAYQDATKLTYKYTDQVLVENVKLFAVFKSATPVVSVYGNTIEWASTGATSYTVTVKNSNGTELYRNSGSATSATYDFTARPEGEYIVTVTAGEQTATAYYKNKALARVSRFTILENSSIIFDGVDNATGYYITVDCGNDAHAHTSYYLSTSKYFNFANCEMQKGGIKFTVQAVANGYLPSVSETYVYSRDLAQVQNVRYDETNGKVVWDAVDGAMSYNVVIENGGNNYVYNVDTASVSVKNFSGNVKVTVTAVASGYNSGDKTTLEYTTQKLATPENLAVSGENISWSPVAGASKYNVTIGQYSYTTTATSYEIPVVLRTPGAFEVSVQAVGETEATTSYYSDALTVNYKILKNVLYANGKLTWSAVGGASEYVITVNGKEQSKPEATATSAAITFTKAGENMIGFSAYDMSGKLISQEIVKVNASKVTFDEQGGSAVKDVYLAVGDPFKFEESTNMGYDFAGWYNVPGGPKNNGAKYNDGDVFQGGTTYVYAYWAPKAYTVTLIAEYDVDGDGTLETYEATETVYYMEHFEFDVPDLQGATFGGWYSERNSIGTLYTDSKGRSNDVWRTIGDSTAYAGWLNNVLAFELINNGTAYQVTQGTGIANVTEVTIPAVYNGKPVTTIAASAFLRSDLEVINIPDTVETIFVGQGGPYAAGSAFQYCYDLKEINVYCTDASHGDHSLYKPVFESEEGVLIKNDQEVGKQLYFFPMAKVGDYRVPDGIQLIPMRTFYDADDLTSITIPASVTTIEKNAFYSTSNVTEIIFEAAPAGQEEKPLTIGANAFYNCYDLTEINLPARLQNMANDEGRLTQFDSCYYLENINITGTYEDAYYGSREGFLYDESKSTLLYSPAGKKGEITLPVGTETVASYAFSESYKITTLNVPFYVEEIAAHAFDSTDETYALRLETINFQGETDDDVLTIGEYAFYGCVSLKDLVIGENVGVIGEYAFGDTTELRNVTINSAVETPNFANNVFCTADEKEGFVRIIDIGSDVAEFSVGGVFYGCHIARITADDNDYYFAENDVLFNKAKTKILYYPYGKTENYSIPDNVKIISDGVFANKANITSVNIGANIEVIGDQAFAGCEYLETLTFDQERTTNLTIGANAFEGTKITTATIPDKTVSIGDGAFKGCSKLATVSIPASTTKIGTYEGDVLVSMSVFEDCAKLSAITVDGANEAFSTSNGILFAKTAGVVTDLCFVPKTATGTVEIPKTVKKLWAKAFYQNTGITGITFEDNTAAEGLDLGEYAFAEMTKLTSIDLPAGLTAIPKYTFYNSSVTSVSVPNTVETVGLGAFTLSKVSSVNFAPGNETTPLTFENAAKAADGVFAGTENLKTITLPERTDGIASYMFAKTAKPSSGGSDDIIIRPRAILPILPGPGGESSDAIPGLRKLVVPSTVTKIYDDAFNGAENLGKCTQLRACTDKSTCTHGGLTFAANGDGDYSLTEIERYAFYGCKSLYSIDIPDTVTTIGVNGTGRTLGSIYGVFEKCESLVSVKLPAALESVYGYSSNSYAMFDGCTSLTDVTIPEGVKKLDTYMFYNCPALEEITIPSTVTAIPKGLFVNCTSLETVNIPDSIVSIGAEAFSGCTALTSIDIPTKVHTISEKAFAGSGLTSFIFPESVNSEGGAVDMSLGSSSGVKQLFSGCENLTTVTISKAVKDISDLFAGCNSITTIVIKDGHQNLKLDDQNKLLVLNMQGTRICSVLGGADTNGKFTIPAGVTEISDSAFKNATWIKSIEIPNTVTRIGDRAFEGCTNLASVTFAPNSKLDYLGTYAFGLTALTTIVLPDSLTALNGYTFYKCTSLESVTLPNKLEKLGAVSVSSTSGSISTGTTSYDFYGCTALTSIVLPDTLTIASSSNGGSYAFYGCDALTNVTLPAGITYVPSYMFQYCDNLTTVTLEGEVESIGGGAFQGCPKLTNVNGVTDTLTTINTYAFSSCTKLASFYFSKNLTSIGVYAFRDCNELAGDIVLPETVTTLGDGAFRATKITSLVAPGLTKVSGASNITDMGAFSLCTELESVTFGDVLTTITYQAFSNCTALTTVNIPSAAPLTTVGVKSFLNCPITAFNFPGTMTTIGNNAFENTKLELVSLPASVTSIGSGAFANCANLQGFEVDMGNPNYYAGGFGELYDSADTLLCLPAGIAGDANGYMELGANVILAAYAFQGSILKSVGLPITMTEIPEGLFKGSSIETIEIPASVEVIGNYAFQNCASLHTVYFAGDKVKTIGLSAFNGCESLKTINIPNSVEAINGSAFKDSGIESFVAPEGMTSITANSFENAKALKTVTLHNGITSIGMHAFCGTAIKQITIPASVTEISVSPFLGGPAEIGAFENCTELETVVFEGSMTTDMGGYMFSGCTKLKNVTLPSGMKTITQGMFNGCTSLETIAIPSTVTKIEQKAFLDSGLTQITLPEGLTTIENSAFENTKLVEIEIPSTVTTLGGGASSGGAIPILPRAALVLPGLGDETEEDGDAAYIFKNCKQLTTVTFKGVPTTMSNGIFVGCTALTSVTLADGWTKFADNMFEGCTSLTNFVIPSTVTTMGSNVFKGWTATQKILCVAAEADVTFAEGWNGNATVEYGYVAPTV